MMMMMIIIQKIMMMMITTTTTTTTTAAIILIAFMAQFETAPRTVSNMYSHIAGAQSRANDVHHMGRSSHATWRLPRGTKGQLSYEV